jgi:hypothetical protein
MCAGLQVIVSTTDVRTLKDNTAYAEAVGRVMDTSEKNRVDLVDTVLTAGFQAHNRGEVEQVVNLFEVVIDLRNKLEQLEELSKTFNTDKRVLVMDIVAWLLSEDRRS